MNKKVTYSVSIILALLGATTLVGAGYFFLDVALSKSFNSVTLSFGVLLLLFSLVFFFYARKLLKPDSVVSLVLGVGLVITLTSSLINPLPASFGSALSTTLSQTAATANPQNIFKEFRKNLKQQLDTSAEFQMNGLIQALVGLALVIISVLLHARLKKKIPADLIEVEEKETFENGTVRVKKVIFPSDTPPELLKVLLSRDDLDDEASSPHSPEQE